MDGNDTPLAETMRDADAVVDAALGSDRDPVTVGQQLARERARQAIFGTTPSTQVERFTLLEEVGRGGMGVVFAAYDPKLDRRVAIKLVQVSEVPKTDAGARGDTDDRILAEARAMAKISDPNVVTVYEVGHYAPADASTRPAVFVAMEFVQGQTLREWVQSGPRSQDEIVTAYLAAARGLSAVHAAGLVHRDFKPDNVMLGDDGRVRVMDFGIARSGLTGEPPVEGSQSLPPSKHIQFATATGNVAGTPGYMAPERFAGKKGDARSDQ
ncbi:MAG: serine/threonine-protein kinase, partial [Myxococcota bacterium]